MNFEPSEDQVDVLTGLDQLLAPHMANPVEPVTHVYADALDQTLSESGFLDIAREDGFTLLDAALIVERISHVPQVVEAATSALVAPALPLPAGLRPVALLCGRDDAPVRFLPNARALIILRDDHVAIVRPEPGTVEVVESLLAYPYGRLRSLEDLPVERFDDVALVRRRWQIGLAVEAAACMAASLGVILDHVKSRYAFGRPLGAMQAIQHRLAMAAETAESAKWLARRAAWSDTDVDAAIAASFVQARIPQLTYDLHQFSGAMGLTLEFPLHFWTYRLRALVGELGGASMQTRMAAQAAWPDAA